MILKRALAIGTILLIIVVIPSSTLLYIGLNPTSQKIVTVFCGSASKPVLEEAAKIYEQNTGIKIEIHFGGSGTMLTQMKISKLGDLYIPGSDDYMIRALNEGVVTPSTIKVLSYLVPAIIVQEGNPKNITRLEDLSKVGIKIGIGDPKSVCIGEYAIKIFQFNLLQEEIEPNIIVHAESCSKTASLVITGSVDAIIGWTIFEKWNPNELDCILIKPERIPKISSIAGAISTYSKNSEEAKKFLDFLSSETGQNLFSKYGYFATLTEAKKFAPNAEVPAF